MTHAPENTVAAFQHAVDLGFEHVETDVHVSADGVLFAFHDADLGRLTGVNARIAELQACDIDVSLVGGHAVPRLEEIFTTWPKLNVNIDPKSDAAVHPLVQSIRTHKAINRICIGSFSDRRIDYCRSELGPSLCTSMGPAELARFRAASLGLAPAASFVAPCAQIPLEVSGKTLLDSDLIAAAARLGIELHIWTINAPSEMQRLIDLGVDGIITDDPAALKQVLADNELWGQPE